MAIRRDSSTTAIVPFLLEEDNFEDWRIYIENYLLAQDLWGIIESGDDADFLSSSNDMRNWRKKNAAALHAIHTTTSSHIFAQIKEIRSAKDAWNKLAKMHQEWQSKSKLETGVEGLDGGKEEEMTEDSRFVELKNSICKGDRNAVKQYFVFDKHALDTIVESDSGFTALHVAIFAGQDKIAEELVKIMSETDLEIKTRSNTNSATVLNAVAITGRTHMAKCIVLKNNKLLTIENGQGRIPVCSACSMGHKEMTNYLYSVTRPEFFLPRCGNHGFDLMRRSIENKMLDICLDLLQRNPELTVTTNHKMQGPSPIFSLSRQSSAFFSGSRLRFWQRLIYHWLNVKLPTTSSGEVRILVSHQQDLKEKDIGIQGVYWFTLAVFGRLRRLGLLSPISLVNRFLIYLGIKQIYDLKSTHLYAHEILGRMCNHVSTLKVQHLGKCGVIASMFEATKQGMVEFVIELLKVTLPYFYANEDGRGVFTIAIQYRQENIFNLLYGIHEAWTAQILNRTDAKGNSVLHVVGEIAPDFQLARISNSALQMQREIQWFKEVERIVPEWCKEIKNFNGETPYEVFSKSHKELVKEGAKWMKDTANSFIIVGTLIVTILFAAAFTLPGGNDQSTGFPIFLPKRSFMIFIISDAVSFFAASTSVLMFLGILTSRFAQEDFLESLPRKLIIGLSTLFISVAAMTVSFSAALLIILQDRWWAIIPVIMMASIPVVLFVWLQFPLLVEIFVSTYAPGIFNRKMKPWI
ncbi:hypothetical protein SLA2020_092800 [Shorea laevis]